MIKSNNHSGASKIGFLFVTIFVIVIAYAAIKYIPTRLNAYEFQDAMERIARDPAYYDKNGIISALVKKANELDLPIKENQIKVDMAKGRVEITVDYQVVIVTPFMEKTLEFHPKVSEKRIF